MRRIHSQILLAVTLLLPGTAAFAQTPTASTPTAVNETQGATTGLGSSHRFPTAAAADSHCSNDTIVWSASANLVYVLPGSSNYGKGTGFYACKQEADNAGFRAAGN